ncbi:MAG: hypothetical protein SGJ05_05460 [bacterium]|nr:hypothetical protein [bacterium]
MRHMLLVASILILGAIATWAQNPTTVNLTYPNGGQIFRPGSTQEFRWDTAGTFRARWRFLFGTSVAGPWTPLTGAGAANVLDSAGFRGQSVPGSGGWRVPATGTTSGYIRMELIADPNVYDISDNPFTIESPTTIVPDSILTGEINGTVHLHANKIYGLQGYVYVNNGGQLIVDAGTIVVGDLPGNNSALIVNRGGKLIAVGSKERPIIFTSRAAPGQRARGDWGGILMCGSARVNQAAGQAALEGGVADATAGGKGWYGGTDDDDSSGALQYVRIEFAGIATQPNSELNGLTMGGLGRRTVLDYIQVSYGNDDAFEWFGGAVNAKHLIAYGTLDDDFDCDNGYSGKVQFGLVKRFRTVADVSTSEAFEIDNDAQGSYLNPRTQPVFSNITAIGPIQDTSWTPGSGNNQYSSRFGAAAQIRRAARASIFNTVFIGWPRGFEIAQSPTMLAAYNDSLRVRNNSWFGVKNATLTLASGTPPAGMDANWLATAGFDNSVDKANPNNASLVNAWPTDASFDPRPTAVAPYLNAAAFVGTALAPINDAFFTQVEYRGAFSPTETRWDETWAEYDPVNAAYRASAVLRITSPGGILAESFTIGQKVTLTWDTSSAAGNRYKFEFATSVAGPWVAIAGAADVTDAGTTRGKLTEGFTVPNTPTTTGYIRMSLVSDPSNFDISEFPFSIRAQVDTTPVVRLIEPGGNNRTFRVGQSVDVRWDTTNTFRKRFRFEFGMSPTGPWTILPGLSNVLDSAARRGQFLAGIVFRPDQVTTTGYVRMTLLSDTTKTDVNDQPFTITAPSAATCDSILSGEITSNVVLHNTKVYCLDGYVYVNDGATLTIEPGTIILGDTPGENSALIVNRGGKIMAEGTAALPIVFTSRATLGQRARGDWGGILICGKATINQPAGEASLEGGVSSPTSGKGWYGGTNDDDNSGVLNYVRIEFAGIATQPNSELNGLTMGGVGRGTRIEHVQVSFGNDDAFEWFGGTVNARHLIATGTLDDDFDTDNGFRGRVQFAVVQRLRTVADVSTSQAFESDNDAQGSFNKPYTSAVFSNVTAVGPLMDTSWTVGAGANQYSSRFGAGAQIRRNSRQSIHNSVFLGWPRGFEIAQVPTMAAALADSLQIRNNAWYGVKGAWLTLAGGTPPAGLDANWLATAAFNNTLDKSSPDGAQLENAFTIGVEFNPALKSGSPLNTGAAFEGTANDPYFERVAFRGAFGMQRWDALWAQYDPVNAEYKAQPIVSVEEEEVTVTAGINGSASPNPTSDATTIRYELKNDDIITIRVMDVTGGLTSTFIANERLGKGFYEFRLITSDLASGVYYMAISGTRGTITIPVTVTR